MKTFTSSALLITILINVIFTATSLMSPVVQPANHRNTRFSSALASSSHQASVFLKLLFHHGDELNVHHPERYMVKVDKTVPSYSRQSSEYINGRYSSDAYGNRGPEESEDEHRGRSTNEGVSNRELSGIAKIKRFASEDRNGLLDKGIGDPVDTEISTGGLANEEMNSRKRRDENTNNEGPSYEGMTGGKWADEETRNEPVTTNFYKAISKRAGVLQRIMTVSPRHRIKKLPSSAFVQWSNADRRFERRPSEMQAIKKRVGLLQKALSVSLRHYIKIGKLPSSVFVFSPNTDNILERRIREMQNHFLRIGRKTRAGDAERNVKTMRPGSQRAYVKIGRLPLSVFIRPQGEGSGGAPRPRNYKHHRNAFIRIGRSTTESDSTGRSVRTMF
ncbi:hypothetical protein BaRGS_00023939 [Batillaria attramentaria]|uniref:Uncharacterized protein n=1 Tax=Batillaria attramentaria TaxID=370345 RepID=A0ABD0KCD5_9CAEN